MKKCNCGATNPDDASFCKFCGKPINLDPMINWITTSQVTVYRNLKEKIMIFLMLALFCVCLIVSWVEIECHFNNAYSIESSYYKDGFLLHTASNKKDVNKEFHKVEDPIMYISIIGTLATLSSLLYISYGEPKTKRLRTLASEIEKTKKRERLITKNGNYGLYDFHNSRELLPANYQCIIYMKDNNYLIIENSNKYGIYSILLKKIIIECNYDSISELNNNRFTLQRKNMIQYSDIQGNIFN